MAPFDRQPARLDINMCPEWKCVYWEQIGAFVGDSHICCSVIGASSILLRTEEPVEFAAGFSILLIFRTTPKHTLLLRNLRVGLWRKAIDSSLNFDK
ncbi:hypothetical protein Ddc_03949 [Ditylenchus destructor]|nr:hypothetical protein Ddc_03949 [Ditylenchus destructor]